MEGNTLPGQIRIAAFAPFQYDPPRPATSIGSEFIVKDETDLEIPRYFLPDADEFSPYSRKLIWAWGRILLTHMVASARSKGPLGPWENSPHNPIICTWDRDEACWSKGHGTLVEGSRGDWYCVLLGHMNGFRTLGRCTLIEPIQWTEEGWFRAADQWPASERGFASEVAMPLTDEFDGEDLGIQWQFHRQFDNTRYELKDRSLILKGFGDTLSYLHALGLEWGVAANFGKKNLEVTGLRARR